MCDFGGRRKAEGHCCRPACSGDEYIGDLTVCILCLGKQEGDENREMKAGQKNLAGR